MKKFLFCLLSLFLIRVLISCCPCEISPILLNINTITISNLNNSSDVHDPPRVSQSDSMYSSAVAFEVALSDSTYEKQNHRNPICFNLDVDYKIGFVYRNHIGMDQRSKSKRNH